jgi:hypothetical protein
MKHGSTLILKAVISLIGAGVFALCVFLLPAGILSDKTGYYRPILIGMYVPAIPFFFGLYQGLKLLSLIDRNKVFSELSVKALRTIKFSAAIVSALYTLGLPYIYYIAEKDDAPGVMLIGLIFTFVPLIISVFAAVFEKMLQDAIVIKSENDLTV